jgi:hypothetical protein
MTRPDDQGKPRVTPTGFCRPSGAEAEGLRVDPVVPLRSTTGYHLSRLQRGCHLSRLQRG